MLRSSIEKIREYLKKNPTEYQLIFIFKEEQEVFSLLFQDYMNYIKRESIDSEKSDYYIIDPTRIIGRYVEIVKDKMISLSFLKKKNYEISITATNDLFLLLELSSSFDRFMYTRILDLESVLYQHFFCDKLTLFFPQIPEEYLSYDNNPIHSYLKDSIRILMEQPLINYQRVHDWNKENQKTVSIIGRGLSLIGRISDLLSSYWEMEGEDKWVIDCCKKISTSNGGKREHEYLYGSLLNFVASDFEDLSRLSISLSTILNTELGTKEEYNFEGKKKVLTMEKDDEEVYHEMLLPEQKKRCEEFLQSNRIIPSNVSYQMGYLLSKESPIDRLTILTKPNETSLDKLYYFGIYTRTGSVVFLHTFDPVNQKLILKDIGTGEEIRLNMETEWDYLVQLDFE